MRTFLTAIIASLLLCACKESEPIPDRSTSPEAAFLAAKAALKREDYAAYLDAMTSNVVHLELQNAIGICLISRSPDADRLGLTPSTGCDAILRQHGWTAADRLTPESFQAEIAKIGDQRALALALVNNNRKTGAGLSFVWDYLEDSKLSNVVVNGNRATATLHWASGDANTAQFERDATGWRFDPGLMSTQGDEGDEGGEDEDAGEES